MKSGNRLRTQMPNKEDALKRLEALGEWSEQPAKEAAAAIAAEEPGDAIALQKAKGRAGPWLDGFEAEARSGGRKAVTFNMPIDLYLKLRWLGQTTFGQNMTSIITSAIEDRVDQMLHERGLNDGVNR